MAEALKTPIQYGLNDLARLRATNAIQATGKALPASIAKINSSGIVTVEFPISSIYTLSQVTIPVLSPEYIRIPLQVGDKGIVVPADSQILSFVGLGSGTPNLTRTANLTPLSFIPISTTSFAGVDNNSLTLYGPNGVVLRDSQSKTIITLTPSGITITLPSGDALTINGNVVVSGNMTVNGSTTTVQNLSIQGTESGGGPV